MTWKFNCFLKTFHFYFQTICLPFNFFVSERKWIEKFYLNFYSWFLPFNCVVLFAIAKSFFKVRCLISYHIGPFVSCIDHVEIVEFVKPWVLWSGPFSGVTGIVGVSTTKTMSAHQSNNLLTKKNINFGNFNSSKID